MMLCDDDMMLRVRTTVNIDEHLLIEAKLVAAREHRTIGSVLEDGLRRLFEESHAGADHEAFVLPNLNPGNPGARPGIDINDSRQLAEILGDNDPPAGL